jgi:hypothetical protein
MARRSPGAGYSPSRSTRFRSHSACRSRRERSLPLCETAWNRRSLQPRPPESFVPREAVLPSSPPHPEGCIVPLFQTVPTHPRPSPLSRLQPLIHQPTSKRPLSTTEAVRLSAKKQFVTLNPSPAPSGQHLKRRCPARFTVGSFRRAASISARLTVATPLQGPALCERPRPNDAGRPRLIGLPPLRVGRNFPRRYPLPGTPLAVEPPALLHLLPLGEDVTGPGYRFAPPPLPLPVAGFNTQRFRTADFKVLLRRRIRCTRHRFQ